MKNKLFLLSLFLVCILSISAISAAENTTHKDVISTDNNNDNLKINIDDDVSTSKENSKINLEQNNNDKLKDSSELKFSDLNTTVNGNSNSTIYLSNNYKYDSDSDSDFKNGISITRNLKIYGNGVTIDGNKKARIFHVADKVNVEFHNITFINGYVGGEEKGGAIYQGSAYNCIFINNTACDGGAICNGNAYYCNFTGNKAECGGAIRQGNAYHSIFIKNHADDCGGAIDATKGFEAYNCTFIENTATYDGGAIRNRATNGLSARNCTFIRNSAKDMGGALIQVDAEDCIFINNTSEYWGGAMRMGSAKRCTFINNEAEDKGGACDGSDAHDSIFINNTATTGGAMSEASAYNCNFTGNKAKDGGAIICNYPDELNLVAVNCIFTENEAKEYGGALRYITAKNCIFTSNHAKKNGGGLSQRYAFNCTFTNNKADGKGGAVDNGDAYNCTFKDNTADEGEAMYEGKACLCVFNGDSTEDTDIIHPKINVLNYTSTYGSGEKLIFNLTANNMVLNGFETIISIYKDGSFIKNASCLSGEGWVVDLGPGEYTAVLSITEDSKVKSSNATIKISKGITTINIDPISNAKVGQELTINYVTNSNGTVVISVNGQKINGTKFTPNSKGNYIVNVEIEENDYYLAESNKTTFTVEKTNTVIIITPITNVFVGQEITINYTTNSNGTVVIKVNGQSNDGKFTPTTEGIYNVTVKVEENDYYTAASNTITFNVANHVFKLSENKDLTPLYSAKAAYNVLVTCDGQAVGAGETVTIKFNGKTYTVYTDSKGYATLNLNTKVKPKTYTITAEYNGVKVSNKVTVKNIINAKNKNVEKSKKTNKVKISLKKVNGKYIKGKVLKIKFNKKTYNVKTNKKGTATWNIKNSMIKNLKIGKKYKYTVAYGKDAVSKKLTIKK